MNKNRDRAGDEFSRCPMPWYWYCMQITCMHAYYNMSFHKVGSNAGVCAILAAFSFRNLLPHVYMFPHMHMCMLPHMCLLRLRKLQKLPTKACDRRRVVPLSGVADARNGINRGFFERTARSDSRGGKCWRTYRLPAVPCFPEAAATKLPLRDRRTCYSVLRR